MTSDILAVMTVSTDAYLELHNRLLEGFAAVDSGGATDSLNHLTPDFEMSYGGTVMTRPAYDQVIAAREEAPHSSRHIVTNLRISSTPEGNLTAQYLVTVHRVVNPQGAQSMSLADFLDEWCRDAQGALLLRRRQVTMFLETGTLATEIEVAEH